MSVNDQILDAIELLAKSSVERAGYDKTIQAQVISCEDREAGKYKCRYQDAIFYAYTNNTDIGLSKGSYVYILVPQNNMSKDKTILGTVDKLGVDYVSIIEGENAYEKIGANTITQSNVLYLNSNNSDYKYTIYNPNSENNDISITTQALSSYIKQSQALIIAATIQTAEDTQSCHYGIEFMMNFSDGIKTFRLDENTMVGDPYRLLLPTRQVVIFPIENASNFISLNSVTIFTGDGNTISGKLSSGDIIISNLEIYGANRFSQDQLNGTILSVYTPDGSVFLAGDSETQKRIVAQVRVKGQVVPTDGVTFYWGLEDMNITSYSNDYNQYLGYGWKTLSQQSSQLIVQKSDIKVHSNKYKVAAIYDGTLVTKQIGMQNLGATYTIEITSSDGTQFYNNMGNPTLLCSTTGDLNNKIHRWGWRNGGRSFEQADQIIGIANGDELQEVQISKIINFADFRCTVYNGAQYIGTAAITLTNQQDDKSNMILINNGSAIFKYSEEGVAPTDSRLHNPQLLQPLSFELRDPQGHVVDFGRISLVKWTIPAENTLLQDSSANDLSNQTTNEDPDTHIYTQIYYTNTSTLSYQIASNFDYNKTNNQIKLQVHYNGSIIYAQTNFLFTKQGDIGTNGTEYTVRIVPNTTMPNPPKYPMITTYSNNTSYINYGIGNNNTTNNYTGSQQLFKAQLWRNNQLIWEGNSASENSTISAIKWSILSKKYASGVVDDSDFSIDTDGKSFNYSSSSIVDAAYNTRFEKANIVQCAITYDNKVYYGSIPIITAYVVDSTKEISLKQDSGFLYVVYNSDGLSPKYNTNPFEIIYKNSGEQVTDATYNFAAMGSIKQYSNGAWGSATRHELTQVSDNSLLPYQRKYKPISKYNGQCVNTSILCWVVSGGTTVAKIRIPVHFYLNRFGMADINAWDGNSVQIDENGGYILAPKVGAGSKDTNNRFTGVVMGDVKEGTGNANTGLFGYYQGQRSFSLDSKTGKTILGKQGNSQITIDPSSDEAKLYSGAFYNANGNESGTGGMLINLTTPEIRYGNGGFWVDSDGNLKLGKKDADHYGFQVLSNIGTIRACPLYTTTTPSTFKNYGFTLNALTGAMNLGYNGSGYNFTIDADGDVTLIGDLKAGLTTDYTYNDYNFKVINGAMSVGYNGSGYNFTIDANGNVFIKGQINATSGQIGNGTSKWTIGGSSGNNSKAWIYYGKSTFSDSTTGIYIGTDGVNIGDALKINLSNNTATFNGDIVLTDGSISWGKINNSTFPNLAIISESDGDYTLTNIKDNTKTTIVPHYITSTKITSTTIESPTIYGGLFYATGIGNPNSATLNDRPAYYISNGGTTDSNGVFIPNSPIGFIAYDVNSPQTSSSQRQWNEATNRVLFATNMNNNNQVAMKLRASGQMSFQTGYGMNTSYVNNTKIYFMNGVQFDSIIKLTALRLETSTDGWQYYKGAYGSDDPPTKGQYMPYNFEVGQLYFKTIN